MNLLVLGDVMGLSGRNVLNTKLPVGDLGDSCLGGDFSKFFSI